MNRDLDATLALLRRIDRPGRLRELARALGFTTCLERITRDRWNELGLEPAALQGSLHIVGHGNGATAFALSFNRTLDTAAAERATRALANAQPARHALVLSTDRRVHRIAITSVGPDAVTRTLLIDRVRPRAADAETLLDMVGAEHEGAASTAIRYARALDRARVTGRFFDDFRDRRSAVAAAWTGLPARSRADRDRLALLFLCRLMFLYFLQHAGHLAGNPRFLPDLVRRPVRRGSIYRNTIVPLFFGALNRRPERRTARALRLGDLPYLNGGLFERHALERRHRDLDLPDASIRDVFEHLLERYRFTTREPAETMLDATFDGGIDPEMLGRVFEGVMAADHRSATGAFYTPAHAVDPLVRDALVAWLTPRLGSARAAAAVAGTEPDPSAASALAHARVLDPACGSGAFLLGALSRITGIRATDRNADRAAIRREVVASSLHGVDLDHDAALLCALRLWLALADTDGPVQPLPNLDRRIRQGDTLLDPIDLALAEPGSTTPAAAHPAIRTATRALQPVALEYLDAEPHRRDRLRTLVDRLERAIARAWIETLRDRNRHRLRELRAAAAGRDLFGQPAADARTARAAIPDCNRLDRELQRLHTRLRDDRATPFFSFHVHFADAASRGFDLILSNPPWVRAHRWPRALRDITRRHYQQHTTGWRLGSRLAGAPPAAAAQTDIAILFLLRALDLLAPGGVIGLLMPAKTIRSVYAGAARARLVTHAPILSIRDCSLDQHAIFRADAFAASIVARRPDDYPTPRHVRVTIVRKDLQELEFDVPRDELPLFRDDPAAPWLLAPERVRNALRHMQQAGPPIGLHPDLRVRRGVFTGANSVLIGSHVRPRIGDLASFRALGFDSASSDAAASFECVIEDHTICPLIRGTDIRPWAWKSDRFIIFTHDHAGRPIPPPPRLARYLQRHRLILDRRSGAGRGFPRGAVFRCSADTLSPKVAWHDLAPTLQAVALPPRARSCLGTDRPVIPLNTTYFIPTRDTDHALVLAAFLNATPVRTFARTIAERAKDTHFRFFAWTIAALPLPRDWADTARHLLPIARQAHADHGLDTHDAFRLDQLVAHAFGLDHRHLDHLTEFDRWIGGTS